jgi:hypothetical protein
VSPATIVPSATDREICPNATCPNATRWA